MASLLKRWLLGTLRFNRRKSRSRGKLFYQLVQQAVAVEPVSYKSIIMAAQPGLWANHEM